MQFALMIYHTPEEFDMRKNDYSDPHLGAWRAYYKALVEAGVYVGANALEVPETGTTVRVREGKRRVQDGPYADTKEQLAGFIILELPSVDAALEWAARCPGAARRRGGSPAAGAGSHAAGVHRVNGSNQEDTHRAIERVARESYGRLVAYLSVHTHDLASAEDALSNALVSALDHWPQDGVPQNPEAWLMTAARHSLIDVIRHQTRGIGERADSEVAQGRFHGDGHIHRVSR